MKNISLFGRLMLIAGISTLLISISLVFFVKRSLDQAIIQIKNKLHAQGVQIRMDHLDWNWSHFSIPLIEVSGRDFRVTIRHLRAGPSINLELSRFMGLSIDIKRLEFLAILSDTASAPNYARATDQMRVNESSMMNRIEVLAFLERIHIQSASGNIFDTTGKSLYSSDNIFLLYSKSEGSLRYHIGRFSYRKKSFLENIQGTVIIDSNTTQLPFLVANGKGTSRNWQAKGHISRDLRSLSLFLKSQGIPKEWIGTLAPLIPNRDLINYAIRIQISRSPSGISSFDIQSGSTNFTIQHARLSEQMIGPIAFRSKISGEFHDQKGTLKGQGFVTFQSQENKHQQIQTRFQYRKNDILEDKDTDPWFLSLAVPQTSCQTMKEVLPKGILGDLVDFDSSGTFEMAAKVYIPSRDWSKFSYKIDQFYANCHLIPRSHRFSREFLKYRQPDPGQQVIQNSPQITAFLSSYWTERFNSYLPLMMIAAEDTGFWTHQGIELSSLEAALRSNLKENSTMIGGSTITMQTAKNLFLSFQKTISRKFQELLLADYLEGVLTKSEILKIYANIIEYGPDIYGIAKASAIFFNQLPANLNPIQSLYLASILPSPRKYVRNYCQSRLNEDIQNRMRKVLDRFEALRPSHLAPVTFDPSQINFIRHETYFIKNCPLHIANPTNTYINRY